MADRKQVAVSAIATLFLTLGVTAFGGPAAHIAVMERTVVGERGWLTRAEFVDLIGASNLIPGPNSTELAMHIGRRLAGWRGLLAAGLGFIAPAALLVLAAAALYVRYGPLPAVRGALAGVEPVVVAVVALALWRLAPTALATRRTALIGVLLLLVLILAPWLGIADGATLQVAVLLAGGVAGALGAMTPVQRDAVGRHGLAAPVLIGAAASGAAPLVGVLSLFLFFLGVGASVYGSGYVLLAFLHGGLVVRRGWLTDRQLLDAVAIGQVTPGPVFTAATFIGYLMRGVPGAAAATVGIFLPAFGYVAASAPFLARVQRSPVARGALDGVNAAAIAVLASALVVIARAALVDAFAVGVAFAGLVVAIGTTINPAWIFLAAALLGALAR